MGGAKGRLQIQLLEEFQKHWNNGTPLVRVIPAGTSQRTRKRYMHSAKRLAKRNPPEVVLIKSFALSSTGRKTPTTFAARPGTMVWSEVRQEEVPVEDLDVSPAARGTSNIKSEIEVLRQVKQDMADQGVQLTLVQAGQKVQDLSIEERIEDLEHRIHGE